MMWCVSKACSIPYGAKWDLDNVFAYRTEKCVILRDRWLGITRIVGLFFILTYFIWQRMHRDKAYMLLQPLVGSTDFRVEQPLPRHRKVFSELPYCAQHPGDPPSDADFAKRVCLNLRYQDLARDSDPSQPFIATRVAGLNGFDFDCLQTSSYSNGSARCRRQNPDTATYETHYVANAEHFRLLVRHAVTPSSAALHMKHGWIESQHLPGFLNCGGVIQPSNIEESTTRTGSYDSFDISDLLQCAKIKLDDLNSDEYPLRSVGVGLLMDIEYTHDLWGNLNGYQYNVYRIPFKTLPIYGDPARQEDMTAYPGHPLTHSEFEQRVGVSIDLKLSGTVGQISFSQFMIAWVSTMALTGLVSLAIQFLMCYVLPLRRLYADIIHQRSLDFSNFRKGESYAVEAANAILQANAAWSGQRNCSQYFHHVSKEASHLQRRLAELEQPSVNRLLFEGRGEAFDEIQKSSSKPSEGQVFSENGTAPSIDNTLQDTVAELQRQVSAIASAHTSKDNIITGLESDIWNLKCSRDEELALLNARVTRLDDQYQDFLNQHSLRANEQRQHMTSLLSDSRYIDFARQPITDEHPVATEVLSCDSMSSLTPRNRHDDFYEPSASEAHASNEPHAGSESRLQSETNFLSKACARELMTRLDTFLKSNCQLSSKFDTLEHFACDEIRRMHETIDTTFLKNNCLNRLETLEHFFRNETGRIHETLNSMEWRLEHYLDFEPADNSCGPKVKGKLHVPKESGNVLSL